MSEDMLHPRRLQALRERAGLTARQLSLRAGADQHYVSDLEKGKHDPGKVAIEKAIRFARELDVSLDELRGDWPACQKRPVWIERPWQMRGQPCPEQEEINLAREFMSCSRHPDNYFVPGPMREWVLRRTLTQQQWRPEAIEAYLRKERQAVARDLADREAYAFLHQVVVPEEPFRLAAGQEPDWVRAVARNVERYGGRVLLAVVDDRCWQQVESLIRDRIGWMTWHRVARADRTLAYLRPQCDLTLYTHSPDRVRRVDDAFSAVQALVPFNLNRTLRRLDAIALGRA